MPQALTEFDKKVGKKIRNYRVTHDVSQEEVGEYLGLPRQAISRIENGKRRITPEELEKISTFFDEPVALFLKDDYIYTNPKETTEGTFPVLMADFIYHYVNGLSTKPIGKDNYIYKSTDKFIKVLKHLQSSVTKHLKLKEKKRESDNLR